MTRPALMSLVALLLASPAWALGDKMMMDGGGGGTPSRCTAIPTAALIKAPTGGWDQDLGKANPICDDAVWRIVNSEGVSAKWASLATPAAQAEFLGKIAAVLDKYDVIAAKAETAALAVYDAGKAAAITSDKNETNASLAGKTFKIWSPGAPGKETALSGDPDKDGPAIAARKDALKRLVIPGQGPQTVVKNGQSSVTPGTPDKPGELVYDFYAQLERAKDLLPELAALGVKVPADLHPILVPASPTGLNFKIADAAQALAKADSWVDPDGTKGAFMAYGDRAQRNRWAMHRQYVDNVYQEAARAGQGLNNATAGLDKTKKDQLDAINQKLRAKVAGAIGVEDARKAFDGDVAQDKDYANSEEGKYRNAQITGAEAQAKSVSVVDDGKGGYKVQYTKDGKLVDGPSGIATLKEASDKADDITNAIRDKIMADHPLLAKTDAAIKAFAGGDVAPPTLMAAQGPGTDSAGCDKKGESLGEFKKRVRDEDMEAGATQSAARQKAEEKKIAAKTAAQKKKATLMAGGMSDEEASSVTDPMNKAADEAYAAEIAKLGGGNDDAIADRVARRTMMDSAASGQYIAMVKTMAPQLKDKMPATIKAGKLKQVNAAQAETLFTPFTPKGATDTTTLFDMFIASEWTDGGHLRSNADRCKGSVRAGDYGSLEDCAGQTLKDWLAGRKTAAVQTVAKKDK
jgi:hypothetical protein